jgi:hypothetical protein
MNCHVAKVKSGKPINFSVCFWKFGKTFALLLKVDENFNNFTQAMPTKRKIAQNPLRSYLKSHLTIAQLEQLPGQLHTTKTRLTQMQNRPDSITMPEGKVFADLLKLELDEFYKKFIDPIVNPKEVEHEQKAA